MSKYIFTKLPMDNEFDDVKLQMTTEAVSLSDLIETFQYFLKGAGFHFDGNLEKEIRMSKYIFTKLPMANDEFDDVKLQMTIEAETLTDLIETFQYFLKGAGFHFDGNLEIVTEDDTPSSDEE